MAHPFLTYSAIGDSITLGTGTILFSPTFSDFYRIAIEEETKKSVLLKKFAQNGATTESVRRWLEQSLPIESSNIITITAGGNDLIDAAEEFVVKKQERVLEEALKRCCENMNWIVNHLTSESFLSTPRIIRIVNLYNPLPNLPMTEEWVTKFNNHLVSCTKNKYVKVANVFHSFKGREELLLSFDGVHPNNLGHKVISEAVIETKLSF